MHQDIISSALLWFLNPMQCSLSPFCILQIQHLTFLQNSSPLLTNNQFRSIMDLFCLSIIKTMNNVLWFLKCPIIMSEQNVSAEKRQFLSSCCCLRWREILGYWDLNVLQFSFPVLPLTFGMFPNSSGYAEQRSLMLSAIHYFLKCIIWVQYDCSIYCFTSSIYILVLSFLYVIYF